MVGSPPSTMMVRAPFRNAASARAAIGGGIKPVLPALGFQLDAPVMQKSQRRSQPLNATAKVGINSISSETSTCPEKTRFAPGVTHAGFAGEPVDAAVVAQSRQSASRSRAVGHVRARAARRFCRIVQEIFSGSVRKS
jgi:hypothetical protein